MNRPPIPADVLAGRLADARSGRECAAEYAHSLVSRDPDPFDPFAADLRDRRYAAAVAEIDAWDCYLRMTEAAHDNAVLAEMDYRPSLLTDGDAA